MSYNDLQNTYAHLISMTNALGQTSTWNYDYGTGKLSTAIDANGVKTAYSYNDPLDRLTQIRRAADTLSESQTNYTYPSATEVDSYQDKTNTADQALHSMVLYDGLGRPSESRTYEGSGYIFDQTTYDALGRVAAKLNPMRSGDTAYWTTFLYDALNRPVSV